MGCCGQGRAALARSTATGAEVSARPRGPGDGRSGVNVRYFGGRPVRVRGTATGRIYVFGGAEQTQAIDAADASALIRTGLFVRS
jgi:hypothetical protein